MAKPLGHQFLVNVLVLVLMLYLVITVEQLRNSHCPNSLFSPNRKDLTRLSVTQDALAPTASQARRNRPMPHCASAKTQAKSFLMVFMGHSGSTAIISELRAHSQAFIDKFEPVDHQQHFNTTQALKFTRHFFEQGIAAGNTPGFKIRPMHILGEPEKWRELAVKYDTRIIWQYRKNLMKSSIGEYSNRYLNDSSILKGLESQEKAEDRCNFGVGCSYRVDDLDFLHKTLQGKFRSQKQITDAVHAISGGEGCVREVPYEDYLYERVETLSDLQQFLGFDEEKTAPERYKATGDNMCDVVENWEEVCTNFYGCVLWQHMLDDRRNNCFCPFSSGPAKYCDM